MNEWLKFTIGADGRMAEIDHYREVRNLLGGKYIYSTDSDFWTTDAQRMRKLGDKIAYDFTNTVKWVGLTGQAEYKQDRISAYGMGGFSTIKYTYTNHFRKTSSGGSELEAGN